MTECRYSEPLRSFKTNSKPQPVFTVPLLEQGKDALIKINNGNLLSILLLFFFVLSGFLLLLLLLPPLLLNISFKINDIFIDLGLAFDLQDLDLYIDLFVNQLKRNPTNVELFDLAQSNSEHSRYFLSSSVRLATSFFPAVVEINSSAFRFGCINNSFFLLSIFLSF